MENKRKGLNRHESLQPLSRHHMVGLHTALKLKRAGEENSRYTLDEILKDLRDFWHPTGQNHFREEEEILLPAFAQYSTINRQEIADMLLEHVLIRSLITQILHSASPDLKKMNELGILLENHIRKEERIIFPMIEKSLPEEKLLTLAYYLNDKKASDDGC